MSVKIIFAGFLIITGNLTGCAINKRGNLLLNSAPLLVYDQPVTGNGLKNYRNTSDDYFNYVKNNGKNKIKFSLLGLDLLHASASSQFSAAGLSHIIEQANKTKPANIIIVDLRQESHGFINSGIPVSWYGFRNQHNVNKSSEQIATEEKLLLAELAAIKVAAIHTFKKGIEGSIVPKDFDNVKLERVYSEAELAVKYGIGYKRFFILDHYRPNDKEVDAFVEFIKNLPPNTWLHFHCRGGVGRATTFMTMYDMIRNGKKVKKQDLIARQKDLFDTAQDESKEKADISSKAWKIIPALERKDFINKFYNYVVDPRGYKVTSWSDWR